MTIVAVVTGGAGGIGRATTAALAADGLKVVSVDRIPEGDPSAAGVISADLAHPEAVADLFARVESEFGLPSALVNNAGVYHARDFLDYDPEAYAQVLGVNLGAAFFCTQELVRRLVAAGLPGSVVNVASISGQSGSADAAYGASKGALIALTVGLGRSLGRHGIRVNAVAPGIVDTPMAARIPQERLSDYVQRIPLNRLGSPAEVADAIRFLIGDHGGYITGAVLDVNGGLH